MLITYHSGKLSSSHAGLRKLLVLPPDIFPLLRSIKPLELRPSLTLLPLNDLLLPPPPPPPVPLPVLPPLPPPPPPTLPIPATAFSFTDVDVSSSRQLCDRAILLYVKIQKHINYLKKKKKTKTYAIYYSY